MPSAPQSAAIIGRIAVKVMPDTSMFRKEAQAQLEKATKGLEAKVQLKVDDTGLVEQVRAAHAKAQAAAKPIEFKTKVDHKGLDLVAKKKVKVEAEVKVDEADVAKKQSLIQKLLSRRRVKVPFDLQLTQSAARSQIQWSRQLHDTINKTRPTATPINFKLDRATLDKELKALQKQQARNRLQLRVHADTRNARLELAKLDKQQKALQDRKEFTLVTKAEQAKLKKQLDSLSNIDLTKLDKAAKRSVERKIEKVANDLKAVEVKLKPALDDSGLKSVERRLKKILARRKEIEAVANNPKVDDKAMKMLASEYKIAERNINRVRNQMKNAGLSVYKPGDWDLLEKRAANFNAKWQESPMLRLDAIRRDMNKVRREYGRGVKIKVDFDKESSDKARASLVDAIKATMRSAGQAMKRDPLIRESVNEVRKTAFAFQVDLSRYMDQAQRDMDRWMIKNDENFKGDVALWRKRRAHYADVVKDLNVVQRKLNDVHADGLKRRSMLSVISSVSRTVDVGLYKIMAQGLRDTGRGFIEFGRGASRGARGISDGSNALTRLGSGVQDAGKKLDGMGGRWFGWLTKLGGVAVKTGGQVISVFGEMGSTFMSVSKTAGVIPGLFASLGKGAGGFIKIGAGFAKSGALMVGALLLIMQIVGPLIAGIISLMGALVALAGAITFGLIGALLPLIPILAATAAGFGVLFLAFRSGGEIGNQLKATMSKLAKEFKSSTKVVREEGVKLFKTLVDGARPFIREIGPAMGRVISDLRTKLSDSSSRDAFAAWGKSLPKIFENIGKAGNSFLSGLVGFFVPILPYAERLSQKIKEIAERFDKWANSKKGKNQIADFMKKAWENADLLWQVLKNIGSIIWSLFTVGNDHGGKSGLEAIADKTKEWSDKLKDPKNRKDIQKFFDDCAKSAKDFAKAVEDIAKAVERLNTPENRKLFGDLVKGVGKTAEGVSGFTAGANGSQPSGKASKTSIMSNLLGGLTSKNSSTSFATIGMFIIQGIWGGIKSAAKGSWNWIKGSIIDPIAEALGIHSPSTVARDEIGVWIPAGIWEGIKQGLSSLGEWPSRLYHAVVDGLGDAGTWLKDKGGQILNGLWQGLQEAPGKISEFFAPAKDWITQKFSDCGTWLSDKGGSIKEGFMQGLTGFGDTVGGYFTGAKDWITQKFSDCGTWLSDKGTSIKEGLMGSFTGTKETVSEYWTGAKDWVTQKFSDCSTWLSQKGTDIKNGLTGAWTGLSETVGGYWTGAKGWVTSKFEGAGSWLSTHGQSVKQGLMNSWSDLTARVSGTWQQVSPTIKGKFAGASGWLSTHGQSIKQGLMNSWSDLTARVSGTWQQVSPTIRSKFSGAGSWLSGHGQSIKQGLLGSWGDLSSRVSGAWRGARSWVTGAFNGARGWLSGIGSDIAQGLINGMGGRVRDIVTSAWNLGKAAINAVKGGADSHSPSRATTETGYWVGVGLVNGMNSMVDRIAISGFALGTMAVRNIAAANSPHFVSNVGRGIADNLAAGMADRTRVVTSAVSAINAELDAIDGNRSVSLSAAANTARGEIVYGAGSVVERNDNVTLAGALELTNGQAWFRGQLKNNPRDVHSATEQGKRAKRL